MKINSVYVVVVFFVLLNGITSNNVANPLIRDTCKKVSRNKKAHVYKFCITSIEENPDSHKARHIDELTSIGIKNAMSNMTNVKGVVEKILKERRYKSKLSEKLLRDCLQLYTEGNDSLTKALKYVKSRDYQRVHGTLGDARTVPTTCEMGFNGDNNQTSPVTKENDILFDMVEIPQSFNFYAHILK